MYFLLQPIFGKSFFALARARPKNKRSSFTQNTLVRFSDKENLLRNASPENRTDSFTLWRACQKIWREGIIVLGLGEEVRRSYL